MKKFFFEEMNHYFIIVSVFKERIALFLLIVVYGCVMSLVYVLNCLYNLLGFIRSRLQKQGKYIERSHIFNAMTHYQIYQTQVIL